MPATVTAKAPHTPARSRLSVPSGAAFAIIVILLSFLIYAAIDHQQKSRLMEMEQLIIRKSGQIHQTISRLIYKNYILAALVIQNNGKTEWLEAIAPLIVDDPAISTVLLAPNGIVSNVHPLEDNAKALGFDLFGAGAGNKEAILSREKDDLVFGGPFETVQGGMALVGRLPVWIATESGEKEFWGLTSLGLRYPDVLQGAGLDSLEKQGFAYEIWRINPDTGQRQIITGTEHKDVPPENYIEKHIPLFGADWYFRILHLRSWYHFPENILLLAAGLVIGMLAFLFIKRNDELSKTRKKLERLVITDPLTGALNRKGLFHTAQEAINEGRLSSLTFIDLNYFKNINDNYGHNAGDIALTEFADRVNNHVTASHIFSRIGGDEFVLVTLNNKSNSRKENSEKLWQEIRKEFERPLFSKDDTDIYLSFSTGTAYYPEDASDINDLISCADNRMYESKTKRYEKEHRRRRTDCPLGVEDEE